MGRDGEGLKLTMRSSEKSIVVWLLITFAISIIVFFVFQNVWWGMLQTLMLKSSQSTLAVSTTPITGISFPTAAAPVPVSRESISGNVALTVMRVNNPADYYVAKAAQFSKIKNDQQYLVAEIKVRCLSSAKESCRPTEFDCGVKSSSGHDYAAEFSGGYDLKNLFEGGEIKPGQSQSGSVIFVIDKGEHGLVMYYPRIFGFGSEARFILTH